MSRHAACRIAAVLCITAASVAAHAQLQPTCPINGNDISNAFFGNDPEQLLYGVKIRDWKPEYFDAVQRKNEECMTEAHYTEAQKSGDRMTLGNVLSLRGRYLQARDANVRPADASHPTVQAADNTSPQPIRPPDSAKVQDTPAPESPMQQVSQSEPAAKPQDAPEPATQPQPSIVHESPQQTAAPVPVRQAAPVESAKPVPPPADHQGIEISSLQWKLIGVALLANALLAMYLHTAGKLVIYKDYTDAAFTGIAPLLSIIVYFLLRFFEVSPNIAMMVALGMFVILIFFVARSTAKNNNGLSMFFAMSLLAKLTIVGIYYAIMALLIYLRLSGSPRRKGEHYSTYEARLRREAQGNAALMAATTASIVALSAWFCKRAEFTPIDEYFSSSKAIED